MSVSTWYKQRHRVRFDKRENNKGRPVPGYRKLTRYLLRDYNYRVNPKKVYRLCKENGLLLPGKKKKNRSVRRRSSNHTITRPFEMWQLDIKYGYIHAENRFFFIMSIIDVYLRIITDYHVGLRCTGKDLVFTVSNALSRFDVLNKEKLIIRSITGAR